MCSVEKQNNMLSCVPTHDRGADQIRCSRCRRPRLRQLACGVSVSVTGENDFGSGLAIHPRRNVNNG